MQPVFLGQFFPFLSPSLGQVPPSTLQRAPTRRVQTGGPQGGVFAPHLGAVSRQDPEMPQTEPQNTERPMKLPQSAEQPQHSQTPVAARTSLPPLCFRSAPPRTVLQPAGHTMSLVRRCQGMGMGTWSSSQVLHTWSRVVFPGYPSPASHPRQAQTPGLLH